MNSIRPILLALFCTPIVGLAAEGTGDSKVKDLDLLGGAAFNDTWITLGIGSASGTVRDGDAPFDAIRLGFGGYSVAGYSSREKKDAGGLLGGAVLVRSWLVNNHGLDYLEIAPSLALVGGGFWKPAPGLRFDVTAEAGPGLGFGRSNAGGGGSRNETFKPTFYGGVHGSVRTQIQREADLAVIVGYEYDYLPEVTIAGPVIALAFIWRPQAAVK
jgi:hypothetical protein